MSNLKMIPCLSAPHQRKSWLRQHYPPRLKILNSLSTL